MNWNLFICFAGDLFIHLECIIVLNEHIQEDLLMCYLLAYETNLAYLTLD